MIAVKVVLSNGEDDTLELGPFSQGVVFEGIYAVDVATSEKIAGRGVWWFQEPYDPKSMKAYERLFVHAAEPAPYRDPQTGDRRSEYGIDYTWDDGAGEWFAQGEARVDGRDGNTSVKWREEGDRVWVCDIFGGHVGSVSRAEWKSWPLANT